MHDSDEVFMLTMEEIKKHRIQLLISIVDRSKAKAVTEILFKQKVHIQYACLAQGTANSEILDFLGIGSTEKAVILCLEADFKIPGLLHTLNQELKLTKAGRGIAFTIPLSGASGPILYLIGRDLLDKEVLNRDLLHDHLIRRDLLDKEVLNRDLLQDHRIRIEKEVEKMSGQMRYNLIVAVINQGNSEDLMDVAKSAGATGGTVIHARRIGLEKAVKFFGIAMQAEKEIVAILTKRENKHAIMQAISQRCGIKSESQGFFFSLPVDKIVGLDLGQGSEEEASET